MTAHLGILLDKYADDVAAHCAPVADVEVTICTDPAELIGRLRDFDALVVQNATYTADVAANIPPRLRWIQAASTGIDAFERHGLAPWVELTNAGDIWAPTVAEHALAMLLGLTRQLPLLERHRQARIWERAATADAMTSLSERTLLIVGLGAIGRQIARRAKAFDMRIIGLCRHGRAVTADDHVDEIDAVANLHSRLRQADAVILAVPLTDSTHHLIDARALRLLKPGALLVNVARGGVVDEAALLEALAGNRLGGVGLDVVASEPLPADSALWRCERVMISPHVAGFDDGPARRRLGNLCRSNLQHFQARRPLRNIVRTARQTCHAE